MRSPGFLNPSGSPEEPLRGAEALLRGFYDSTPLLLALVEIAGTDIRYLGANAAMERFYGVAPGAVRGQLASKLGVPERMIQDWISRLRDCERFNGRIRFEYSLTHPDGDRWLMATIAPLQNPDGVPCRFLLVIEDVTERHAIEDAGYHSESSYARAVTIDALVDTITDVFFAVDREGHLTYANLQAERTFMVRREDLLGRHIWDIFPKAKGTQFETECRRALEEQATVCFEEYAPSYDAWFETHVYPGPNGLSVYLTDITSRKRQDEERHQLMERLEQALRRLDETKTDLNRAQAVARTGSWRMDVRANKLLWSDETHRIFGLPIDAPITYDVFLDCIHPDDREKVDTAWKDALAGAIYEIDHRIVVDGHVKWVHEKAELEIDEHGDLIGGFGAVQDITDRIIAEQALRESEERTRARAEELQAVLDAAPVAIWIAGDPQCRQITGNAYADEHIMQVPRGSNVSRSAGPSEPSVTYTVRRDGVALDPSEMPAQQAVATGQPVRDEVLVLEFSDGRSIHLQEAAVPLFDAEGHVRGAVATGADVTPLIRAEQALRESEDRYRTLVELSPDTILILRDNRVVFANPSAVRLFGAEDASQILNTPPLELLEPGYHQIVAEGIGRLLEGKSVPYLEIKIVRLDGEVRDVDVAAAPFQDQDGPAIQVVLRDTTERKRMESELKARAEALEAADRAKDRFVAILAHELRNPLNATSTALQTMRMMGTAGSRPEDRFTEIIERQMNSMARLVDDLSDVARIGQGKLRLDKERVALSTIFEHAVETAKPLLEAKGHRLEVLLPDIPVWLYADPGRLIQVVSNLLNNAVKYTDEGGVILLEAREEAGEVVLQVKDNGMGIPPEMLDRIFDMFSQATSSASHARAGLGIGLTLVRQLVELHGGTVEAWSEGPGSGSTLTVHLPTMDAPSVHS